MFLKRMSAWLVEYGEHPVCNQGVTGAILVRGFIPPLQLTLYSIDTRFYVRCSRQHLKTLWQRKKLLRQDVFKAFQLKKSSFLSAEWTFKNFLKCRLLQDCCMGERVNSDIKLPCDNLSLTTDSKIMLD